MEIYHSFAEIKACRHAVVALGTFDGVHSGHRQVIQTAIDEAAALGVTSLVITFSAHPLSVLAPEREPLRLATLEQKIEYIEQLGVDGILILPVTRELLGESPEDFSRSLLTYVQPTEIIVGTNFTYGRGAAGDAAALTVFMKAEGVPVKALALLGAPGRERPVSSTVIRECVASGRMEEAASLLGRPFEMTGEVVKGDRRGNAIGFATAKMLIPVHIALPPDGVYATTVTLDGKEYPAMTNIGNNPTFSRQYRRVETHIINWSGNLYGKKLRLRFYKRLRDEKKFDSITELVAAMKNDEKNALLQFFDK